MAWARPPGAPELPSSPYEALAPRENYYKSLVEIYGFQILGAIFGATGPFIHNKYFRRPYFAGIWKHITLAAGFSYMGLLLRDIKREKLTEKYEVMRHYISLHPDDFPPYKRQLIKDMFLPWEPRR